MDEALLEDEEMMFDSSAIEKVLGDNIENTIGKELYSQDKIPEWTNKIIDNSLQALATLNKPFK